MAKLHKTVIRVVIVSENPYADQNVIENIMNMKRNNTDRLTLAWSTDTVDENDVERVMNAEASLKAV
jgi:hypothetical protein